MFDIRKKGVMFFTVDALMAGIIFTLTVVLLLSFSVKAPESIDAKYYIDGYLDYVSSTKMNEINDNYKFIYFDPQEKNPDLYVYQKVLLMKYNGQYSEENMQSFVQNFTDLVVPAHIGVEYSIDGVPVYVRPIRAYEKEDADIYLTTTIITYVFDENNVMYGPNVTKLSIWV